MPREGVLYRMSMALVWMMDRVVTRGIGKEERTGVLPG